MAVVSGLVVFALSLSSRSLKRRIEGGAGAMGNRAGAIG